MSRNIWVISDTHLNDVSMIKYCNRPFSSVREMNEAILENWNTTVRENDIVYHLGDVYMGIRDDGTQPLVEHVTHKLVGHKRLILGNHDNAKDNRLQKMFQKIMVWRMFPEFGLLLTHVPVHPLTLQEKCPVNLHGHIHQNIVMDYGRPDRRYKNMCVEHTNYRPINIEELRSK